MPRKPAPPPPVEATPPHGQRGEFLRVTITLSPEVFQLLADEVTRRKIHRAPNPNVSAVTREALTAYLAGAGKGSVPIGETGSGHR
jgi:hypothetical protein